MKIHHIAIWVRDLENMRTFYEQHFGGKSNKKYRNPSTGLETYFLSFEDGSLLELLHKSGIPDNRNDAIGAQHLGFIHLNFQVSTPAEVDQKAQELKQSGYQILRGPRTTGDGYYEFETADPENNRLEVASPPER